MTVFSERFAHLCRAFIASDVSHPKPYNNANSRLIASIFFTPSETWR
ncbi:hypothetical protein CfE428DRAFT_4169 [Chthoniobacter flavus Ellin428]|uniref:Uncharacterized protein n=1 Tax=Chthoniobacter flavus Ellin428 TaxID=497964 RepID=B4D5I0_9BACT|nr:hypothetical protein CfE428DRAFT_4169 [Chthoniobacter flavus Ellin428]TCO91405.1 hypothetical protein EV701_108133 [Chthoniobacter flavus]